MCDWMKRKACSLILAILCLGWANSTCLNSYCWPAAQHSQQQNMHESGTYSTEEKNICSELSRQDLVDLAHQVERPTLYNLQSPKDDNLWDMFVDLAIYANVRDPKTIADSTSNIKLETLLSNYKETKNSSTDCLVDMLNAFYIDNFTARTDSQNQEVMQCKENQSSTNPIAPPASTLFFTPLPKYRTLIDHIDCLWDKFYTPPEESQAILTTRINLKHPFVAPGGRFQECYYWDAFWINKGLMLSQKKQYIQDTLNNFSDLLKTYNFIPNGTRHYYTNRSQPPLFLSMLTDSLESMTKLKEKFNADMLLNKSLSSNPDTNSHSTPNQNTNTTTSLNTNQKVSAEPFRPKQSLISQHQTDMSFYNLNISPSQLFDAEKEYLFWENNRRVLVKRNNDSKAYHLFRYRVTSQSPRPEMLKVDLEDGYAYMKSKSKSNNINDAKKLFSEIVSATESGWDFSTRWREYHEEHSQFGFLQTSHFIPVDLNSIILKNLRLLAAIYKHHNLPDKARIYAAKAQALAEAMDIIFWDSNISCWRDAEIDKDHQPTSPTEPYIVYAKKDTVTYMSDLYPLFFDLASDPGNHIFSAFYSRMQSLNSPLPGTSTYCWQVSQPSKSSTSAWVQNKGDQWDGNTVWPPLIQLLLEYLIRSSQPSLALDITHIFMKTLNIYYSDHKVIPEKLSFENQSIGEYTTQSGFGWTNGVILWMAYIFADHLPK
ncbi:alpha,alpha-trehalase [Nematocida homosporus]|uniref:alpha,alpha-trehalase n=1 Tax=Nematocida homosporus TaxID=1912981 RepID=UPI00221FDFDA|nr:alpha,alpha-trehalase [Nematocida homosporus]KAI5186951.1 alpha,alpha-trehalase [Nematocida homosporus]